jgi:hypothetical protein
MPEKKKPGSAPKDVELTQVETLASIACTMDEIAAVIGLSKRQLIRRAKELKFGEAIQRGLSKGRASLRRMQWECARSGQGNVTALIWLGKQMLGQRSFEHEKPAEGEAPDLIIQVYPGEADAGKPKEPKI